MTPPSIDRTITFPLRTTYSRPEYSGYSQPQIPTVRQVEIHIPGNFDGIDVDRIAEVLRSCIDVERPPR